MAERVATWCPRCLGSTGEAEQCPKCRLPQGGAEVDRLRQIVVRLHEISTEQSALAAEIAGLRQEQIRLFAQVGGQRVRRSAPPGTSGASFEWRWEVVREVLLWLGAALVGVAALIFAAVAWGRLSDEGRALMLLGATVVTGAAAVGVRQRLSATAQALSGLTAVLVLVDWYVFRKAGVAEAWSGEAWWALATGLTAVGAGLASGWFPVQRILVAVLAQVSAVLIIAEATNEAGAVGLALALAAAIAAGFAGTAWGDPDWRTTAAVLAGGSALMLLAAGVAGALLLPADHLGDGLLPAAVVLAMGLAPGVARWRLRTTPHPLLPDGLVAGAATALVTAGTILIATAWVQPPLFAPVAVLGLVVFAVGKIVHEDLQRGIQFTGSATVVLSALAVTDVVAQALVAPLSWARSPWSGLLTGDAASYLTPPPLLDTKGFGTALLVYLALAAAVALCLFPGRGACLVPPGPAAGVAVFATAGIVAVLPLAAGWPVWAACATVGLIAAVGLVASARADRFTDPKLVIALAGTGAVLAATASGWALSSEALTLAWLAVLVVAGVVAAATAGRREFRLGYTVLASAAFLGETVAATASLGGEVNHCGFVMALAAGALVAAGAHWPRHRDEGRALEAAGVVGLAVGASLAATAEPWLALTLTVTVAWLSLAGASAEHRHHLWAAGWVAVGATWAWVVAADVTVVEAYTLPACTAALISGAVVQRRSPKVSSWITWAPGLLIGLAPTLALAVTDMELVRRLAVTAGGFAVVVVGARSQRQAPLVFGALTLVTIALDALAPVATELPRWLTIGTVGVLLLWLGATAERRVAEFRRLRQRFDDLEPEGWSPFLRRFGNGPEGGARPA